VTVGNVSAPFLDFKSFISEESETRDPEVETIPAVGSRSSSTLRLSRSLINQRTLRGENLCCMSIQSRHPNWSLCIGLFHPGEIHRLAKD
jgi:hypothetical protein